jgi:hypothetical protein
LWQGLTETTIWFEKFPGAARSDAASAFLLYFLGSVRSASDGTSRSRCSDLIAAAILAKSIRAAMSSLGQDEDLRRGRDAGFDHHLVKPADLDALRAVVSKSAQP